MRKVGFILLYIAVAMIGFGIGWMIEEKKVCDNTTNIEWYIKNDCMKYQRIVRRIINRRKIKTNN